MKGLIASLFAAIFACGKGPANLTRAEPAITQTEHGWQTDRVIATRYQNATGFNIGFRFPLDPYQCDRAEISELIAGFGGYIYQGGGSPGAESFAVFEGVTDRATADAKIKSFLPELTLLMRSLNDPKATKAILFRHPIPERKCKDGEPGGSSWPGGLHNGKYYEQFCWICRNGKMVVDEEASQRATDRLRADEKSRADLVWAAQTRILSQPEMTRLRELGPTILVPNGQSFREEEVDRKFNDLLLQQFRMREALASGRP